MANTGVESAREFRRRRAVELLGSGNPPELVARMLGVSRASVHAWQKMSAAGLSLKTKPIPGRRRRMTNEQLLELGQLLSFGAAEFGWPNDLWTTQRVRDVIRRHFHLKFCRSQVWHILTDYMKWTAKRPIRKLRDRDETSIERWKTQEFPRILRGAWRRKAYLVFADESGFMMTPTLRHTFSPPGCPPVNRISDPHGRISVIGAICLSPKHRQISFVYYSLPDNKNFHDESVAEFLRQLRHFIRRSMVLLWDGIAIHSTKEVAQYLGKERGIVVERFPPGAPELNPVDAAWFYLKYDVLANYSPYNMRELRNHMEKELHKLRGNRGLLASFINRTELGLKL